MIRVFFYLFLLFIYPVKTLEAEPLSLYQSGKAQAYKIELVTSGFKIPWGIVFLSNNTILLTERSGDIYIFDVQKKYKTKIKNRPNVRVDGQGGLLDVAISPSYKERGWIYFTYVKDLNNQGVTVLSRCKLKENNLVSCQDLLVTNSATDTSYHFGSRIAFDGEGHVYFGIGDRGHRPNGQDLTNHAGSIIRLNEDGSIPEDNPYRNDKKFLKEVWSFGHRNPQGLVYDFANKRLWEIEHGPRGGDEVNLITKAANYGWPVISYGKEYWGPIAVGEGTHRQGMQQPIKVFTPSIAPGSLLFYTGDAFPEWKGNLFSGALKLRHINRIVLDSNGSAVKEQRLVEDLNERIRALAQSPQGWIYFTTDSGRIYRIIPTKKAK